MMNIVSYLSHARNVQLAIIKSERIKTSRTVPGHIVISVFNTNLVLNLIRLKAPILLDDASIENSKLKFNQSNLKIQTCK